MSRFLNIPFNGLLSLMSCDCIHSCENTVIILINMWIKHGIGRNSTRTERKELLLRVRFFRLTPIFLMQVVHYLSWIDVPFSELMYWIHYKKYRELKEKVEEKRKPAEFTIIIGTHSYLLWKNNRTEAIIFPFLHIHEGLVYGGKVLISSNHCCVQFNIPVLYGDTLLVQHVIQGTVQLRVTREGLMTIFPKYAYTVLYEECLYFPEILATMKELSVDTSFSVSDKIFLNMRMN